MPHFMKTYLDQRRYMPDGIPVQITLMCELPEQRFVNIQVLTK